MERHIKCEVIGQEACPLMLRWTFLDWGFLKAMIHYFPAEISDRDPHDHPRPFVTFVLRGNYRDESWKPGDETHTASGIELPPPHCERVSAGAIKYRSAKHLHIVETDVLGCWTLVVMGPIVREWGFVRLSGKWWDWGKYIQRFGGVTRCDAPPDKMGIFSFNNPTLVVDGEDVPVVSIEMEFTKAVPSEQYDELLGPFVPKIGDFASVPVGMWGGFVENVGVETVWIRDAESFQVRTVNLADVRRPMDEDALRERYYRTRSGG
jgi:hypothetical protein